MSVSTAARKGIRNGDRKGVRRGKTTPADTRTGDGLKAAIYLGPGMLGFLLFIVLPLIASLIISFFSWSLHGGAEFIGLDNYTRMLGGVDPALVMVMLGFVLFFCSPLAASFAVSSFSWSLHGGAETIGLDNGTWNISGVDPALVMVMLGFVLFFCSPLAASFAVSSFSWSLHGGAEIAGADPAFWIVMRNTVVFAILYTILNLIIAIALSYWLQAIPEKWSRLMRVIFFIPVVTPMAGNALIWRLLLNDNGVVNNAIGIFGIEPISWLNDPVLAMGSLLLMSLWQGLGYNIVVLTAGLNGLNTSVLEAAKIDGTNGWNRFFLVVFPMISPTVFFCTVMTVIGAFKVFAQPYFLTLGGPGESTNTMVLYLYRNGFSFDKLGYASALAWVLFVVVMLITALQFTQQKRWVNYDA